MIDVFCCLFNGEDQDVPDFSSEAYSAEWVDRLYRGIKNNTTKDFNFYCLMDKNYQFKETAIRKNFFINPDLGWGNIMEAFRPDIGTEGNRRLIIGLDTIIKGNLDEILNYSGECGLLQDPYHTDTICNGIGIFSYEQSAYFWSDWIGNFAFWKKSALYGGRLSEMQYLRIKVGETADRLDQLYPNKIQSYKKHYRHSLDEQRSEASIVYFHGRPKMQDIEDRTLLSYWT